MQNYHNCKIIEHENTSVVYDHYKIKIEITEMNGYWSINFKPNKDPSIIIKYCPFCGTRLGEIK